MKIAISIPVHEKKDVVLDQIMNIKFYIENPVIVLHISKDFYENEHGDFHELKEIKNVYINPENLETGWGNYYYIKGMVEFDYFILHASNDMYLKTGIEDYIKNYEAGFCRRILLQKHTMWWPAQEAWDDKQLRNIMDKIGQTRIIATQVEGSFYKSNIADIVMNCIKENYKIDKELIYPREEIYFSTIASCFVDLGEVGYPTTYSEVHIFDRVLWKIRCVTRKLYYSIFRHLLKENNYYKFESWYNIKLFKSNFYKIRKKTIINIKNSNTKFIEKNSILNDYPGYFTLYDSHNIFSVKRIARDYKDEIRTYIRESEV